MFAYHASACDNLGNYGHALVTHIFLSLVLPHWLCRGTCVTFEDDVFFFSPLPREQNSSTTPLFPLGMHATIELDVPYNSAVL